MVEVPAAYPDFVRIEWKMIADIRCEQPDVPVTVLANRTGRSAQTIYVWLRRDAYQRYENWVFEQKKQQWTPFERAARADVAEELQEFSGEMLDRLRLIAETSGDDKLVASVSQDWLDRAGYAPKHKTDARATQIILSEGAIRALLDRAREAQGEVVVGEVVPA